MKVFRVCNTPYVFPVVSHAGSAHVSQERKEETAIFIDSTAKILIFYDKTVNFNFKIVLFPESLYFHQCTKKKGAILRILRKMSLNVSLNTFVWSAVRGKQN